MAVVQMHGSFTFSAANGVLRKVLPELQDLDGAVLDLSDVNLMDGDSALAIEEMLNRCVGREHAGNFLIALSKGDTVLSLQRQCYIGNVTVRICAYFS